MENQGVFYTKKVLDRNSCAPNIKLFCHRNRHNEFDISVLYLPLMEIWRIIISLVSAYLFGSIPFGFIVVKASKGIDLRTHGSGRTGGTNAGRAAGFAAGALTGILDFLKGSLAVWLAMFLVPDAPWLYVGAGLLAIGGHNYSIHLLERDPDGTIQLRGGAGGAPALGAAFAMFNWTLPIILPIGLVILLVIGYASLTTLSIAVLSIIIFSIRYITRGEPWQYIVFGVGALLMLLWALRPNIARLLKGDERVVGLRAWLKDRKK